MTGRLRAKDPGVARVAVTLALLVVLAFGIAAQDAHGAVRWDARVNAAVYDTIRGKAGTGGAELATIMSELTGADQLGNPVVATVHGMPYDFGATAFCRWQRAIQPEYGENGITMANEYVREYFEKQDLDEVVKQKWHGVDDTYHPAWGGGTRVDGVQVIGELTGAKKPNEIVLVCGHIDSVAYDGILPMDFVFAPGANDNLSGAATTMICARELAPYEFERTIRFACWGGEEEGLLGSWAYAKRCRSRGEKIVAVVNCEMTGWDYDQDGVDDPDPSAYTKYNMDVHTRAGKAARGDLAIWRTFRDTIATYGVLLNPILVKDAQDYSDHYSFWHYGYGAVAVEEHADPNDPEALRANPYYHTSADTFANMHLAYFKRIASATVGTVAHLARIMEPERRHPQN